MIAHIRTSDGARQSLEAHARQVAFLAERALRPLGLKRLARLTALLHDMGKATQAFEDYLVWCRAHPDEKKAGPAHSPAGAAYAHARWFGGGGWRRLTAQLVSMAVLGHHAGLPDCLDGEGASRYLEALSPEVQAEIHSGEATRNFLRSVADEAELDGLFDGACEEVRALFGGEAVRASPFKAGMLARLLLSAVVDGDRWDSAAFELGEASDAPEEGPPDWKDLLQRLETHLRTQFTGRSPIGDLRAEVSLACARGAENPRGIYTLTVPTGGGKTLSSLRFALAHAGRQGMRRVFYVIPYNTILDQNAGEIRRALGGYAILEHHSGVVSDSEAEDAAHRRLTERWDEGIILTSMVQFLNALFRGENTDARRMRALADSVLVFDEIQALPVRCTNLFEQGLDFLVKECGCTALIMTATQPPLALSRQELIGDVPKLFRDLRRVRYVDETRVPRDNAEAAEALKALVRAHGAALAVVNTRAVAQDLFRRVRPMLDGDVLCAHLSTNMCPAHRAAVLDEVRARLGAHRPVCLVSTQLIEAGVNLSFPVAVRSLAPLSSVIQAGGRCNRNAEAPLGTVFIWRLSEERLCSLREIRAGQEESDAILRHLETHPGDVGDPEVIGRYFEKERMAFDKELAFPYRDGTGWESTLLDMLSSNAKCRIAAKERSDEPLKRLALPQRFRAAGEAFRVIDAPGRGVLVPYGDGARILLALAGAHGMQAEVRLLREAQRFSVNLFDNAFRRLAAEGALIPLGDTGATALKAEFYGRDTGVLLEPGEMDYLGY